MYDWMLQVNLIARTLDDDALFLYGISGKIVERNGKLVYADR